MIVVRGYKKFRKKTDIVVAVGNFDGLHLGHQKILSLLCDRAESLGAIPAVYTFRPHPKKILTPENYPPLISSYREKFELLERFGIKLVIEEPFTLEFSQLSAQFFAENILVNALGAKGIFVGHNFRFGRAAQGDVQLLKSIAIARGVEFHSLSLFELDGLPVSSSEIRRYLKGGELQKATRLLGRFFSYEGIVAKGDGRGRELGFPTANLVSSDGQIVPKRGVYAGFATVEGRNITAVINIGNRPTFYTEKSPTVIEVHLLNFRGDLYSKLLRVYFVEYLREECKFNSFAQLKEQIKKDCSRAESIIFKISSQKNLFHSSSLISPI